MTWNSSRLRSTGVARPRWNLLQTTCGLQRGKVPTKTTGQTLSPAMTRVGVAGFEPTTSSSRTKRATKLRHTPREATTAYRTGGR